MKRKHLHSIDITFSIMSKVFGVFLLIICFTTIYLETHAEDLLEKAFYPAKTQETIIDLGNTKNAVGNEILREGIITQSNLGVGCLVNGQHISNDVLQTQANDAGYTGSATDFCQQILGGDNDTTMLTTQAPFIVRIAKWLLRLTIVLAITMVIYNGIMYIVESAKGGEVKNATKNIGLIIGGILVALLSLGVINLISSITISSLK